MAGLENLFAAEPQLPNVHKTKLPENPEKWAEVLTTNVGEQFPDISKLPNSVEFRKRDDQSGTAIGSIHVISVEAGKSIYIPFVIEKFHMHPTDIWMEKATQVVHPLTQDTFKEIFFVQNFADGLDGRPSDSTGQYFNDPSMWTQTYPPLQGRYSYASAGYEILDQIADTMTAEDLANLKAELTSSPMLLAQFERNGHKEIIQKLASKVSTSKPKDFKASALQLIPKSVVDVKKEGGNKYSILSHADGVFDLATTVYVDRDEAAKFLSKITGKTSETMHDVDMNGEKMIYLSPVNNGVFMFDKNDITAENADKFQAYSIKNKNGLMMDAVVIPDVVNMSGKKVKGKIVISKSHSCMQDNVAGVPMKDSKCMSEVLVPKGIRTGQTGCFVYAHQDKAIATIPVTVKAIEDGDMFHVVDLNGNSMRIRQGYGSDFKDVKNNSEAGLVGNGVKEIETATLESLGFVEVKKEHFVIPKKMMWIPLEPMTDVVATPQAWMEKEAAAKMDIDPVEMRYTGIVYEFKGGSLPKIACSEREAKVMLAQLGMDQTKIAKAMHKAKHTGKCAVHGTNKLKSKKDVEEKAHEMAEKVASIASSLKRTMIKEAAAVDDKSTVDTILALGFLNSENLAKFVSYIPVLEKAADYLAELTLAGRLGLKQVDQAASTGAMTKILEATDGLKKIYSSMKKPTSKVV